MTQKISITISDEVLEFIDRHSNNRSKYINDLIQKEKQRKFLEELKAAYIEQSQDPLFQEEVAVWDVTVGDGIDA